MLADIDLLKRCTKCGETKSIALFRRRTERGREGERYCHCNLCQNAYEREWKHRTGRSRAVVDAKETGPYFGLLAERVLSKSFENVIHMPYGNPGYDFICGKGFKIDAKASCLRHLASRSHRWAFNIRKNVIADYFLCLAFNDRENLEPAHVWLIPGKVLCAKSGLWITNNLRSLAIWKSYEQPLDNIAATCNTLREAVDVRGN